MTIKEQREHFPKSMTDEEFQLRALMPEKNVAAKQTRYPHNLYYNPEVEPVLKLIKGLNNKKRKPSFLYVSMISSFPFSENKKMACLIKSKNLEHACIIASGIY